MYIMAALAVAMGAASCSHNGKSCNVADVPDRIYTGVLPAADAEGVRYTLKLDYDDDKGNLAGDYDLVEAYLVSDSISKTGHKDSSLFKSEGDFVIEDGTGENAGKRYIKLMSDRKDSSAGSVTGPLYFLVESDSTLVLVDSQLKQSETPGLNYTLRLVDMPAR